MITTEQTISATVTSTDGTVIAYERTGQGPSVRAATWYTVFPGGCVTAQLDWTSAADAGIATEARSIIDFTTRQALQQALEQRSGGRLHLDPASTG